MTDKQLLKIKREIEEAKEEISTLKGKLSAFYEQLESVWGCKTLEKAEKKLESLKKNHQKINDQLSDLIDTLEQKYNEYNDSGSDS